MEPLATTDPAQTAEEFPEVREAMFVETGEPGRAGVRLLFVVMQPGRELDDTLRGAINARLRWVTNAIYAVPGLPRALDGKKHEAIVRSILIGTALEDAVRAEVENPEALRYYVDLFNNL